MAEGGSSPDFRRLFEAAPGLYLVLTPELRVAAVSDAYNAATMTRRDEMIGRGIFDIFPDNPDDVGATGVSNLRASLQRVLAERRPDAMAVQKYDIRRPEAEGGGFEVRYWSPQNLPVLGADGALCFIIHSVQDVTEFFRLKDQGSEREKLNAELRTRAGQMEAEIISRAQQLQQANAQLRELQVGLEDRVRERTAALEREIAEKQKAEDALRASEERLRQSQKLEALGRLAGGVAHDYNNLLTVMLSFSRFVQDDVGPDHRCQNDLQQIVDAAQRASALTKQLLAFSRKQLFDPEVLDPNEIMASMHKMLGRLLGEDIDLITVPGARLGRVRADRGSLEQVVLNLVINARDAMPKGGKLTIETSAVTLDATYVTGQLRAPPGPYVLLAVTDEGTGMDEATQAQIFEPFFTTKPVGQGTGLGLSTVYGIVKQLGGDITVYSSVGRGTTFKIYLPRNQDEARPPTPRAADPVQRRGTASLLVVEDDAAVRTIIVRALQREGYQILAAAKPSEALAHLQDRARTVDLLITDVVMPEMSGPEMVAQACTQRPGIRTLFMSGYTGGALVHQGIFDSGAPYIQKPFTPESLAAKVRSVLAAAGR